MLNSKLLIAPNSFKECADAVEIASLLQKHFVAGNFEAQSLPISDGGDGFLKVCEMNSKVATATKKLPSLVKGSLIKVPIGFSAERNQIILEAAEIIGMKKVPAEKRNPLSLTSENFGMLLHELEKEFPRATKILLGLGGTATNDLGLGLCAPFGLKLFDKKGIELPIQPKYYSEVKTIQLPEKNSRFCFEVVSDVKAPLFGANGTSKTFAKQKGANRDEIRRLENGAINIISILKQQHELDFSTKLFGAGGGLLLGLSLLAEVKIMYAEKFLIDYLHVERRIKKSDYIITGEGSFDKQSLMNKGTGIVVQLAKKHNKELFLICGSVNSKKIKKKLNGIHTFSFEHYFASKQRAIKNYKTGLRKAVEEILPYILSHS